MVYSGASNPSPTKGLPFSWGRSMENTFSKWLAETRERRGLSQRSLASKAGISSATVSKVESGDVGVSTEMMKKFAEALEVPYETVVNEWSRAQIGSLPVEEPERITLAPGMTVEILWKEGDRGTPLVLDERTIAQLKAIADIENIAQARSAPMADDDASVSESKSEHLPVNR